MQIHLWSRIHYFWQDIDANPFLITNTFVFGANKFLTKITKLIHIPMFSHMHCCGRRPHLSNQGFLGHDKATIEFYHPIGKQVARNGKTVWAFCYLKQDSFARFPGHPPPAARAASRDNISACDDNVYGGHRSNRDNTRGRNMHLVLQVLCLQANLTITRQTNVTLTVVRTIATIQEMTILETVRLQSIVALVKFLSKQKGGYFALLIIWF